MARTPPLTQTIGQAENALGAILRRVLAEASTPIASTAQWVTLNMIARNGSSASREQLVHQVATALKLDPHTVLVTIDELLSSSLAAPASDDPARLVLAAAGAGATQEVRQRIERITERLYGDLPEEELGTTRRVLATITERANRALSGTLE